MKLFYKASTREGKIVKGLIVAKGVDEAVTYLRSRDLLPIQVTSQEDTGIDRFLSFFKRAGSHDLVFFTSQLASMLASGLTLIQALSILKDQTQNQQMSEAIHSIISDIEEGQPLSRAIARYPKIFSPVYIALIEAAESSGLLDKVLFRLAETLEKQEKLKATIKGALMYPIIVITGMVIVVIIMMIFVIPQLTTLYENLNIPLPLPTQIVVGISNAIIYFWPFIIGLIFLVGFGFNRWYNTQSGRLIVDDAKLRMPLVGPLVQKTILTEFSRTLGLLIGSGTLIVPALRQTINTTGNYLYKAAIEALSRRVERGMTMGDAMAYSPLFPPILTEMVKVGEQTGKVDESITKLSEYFEREVDQQVKTLTTAMEPIFLVVLGAGVAFLIISIITPIYNLTTSIQ